MLKNKIESLLFVSNKPITKNFLVKFLRTETESVTLENIESAIIELKEKHNQEGSGLNLLESADGLLFVTSADSAETIKKFTKDETEGELTPASLETLTVIAY
ncbi:MAG: SMC-Scp complex subunit ScpB, partial [Patescibacteria group bacterium]